MEAYDVHNHKAERLVTVLGHCSYQATAYRSVVVALLRGTTCAEGGRRKKCGASSVASWTQCWQDHSQQRVRKLSEVGWFQVVIP